MTRKTKKGIVGKQTKTPSEHSQLPGEGIDFKKEGLAFGEDINKATK